MGFDLFICWGIFFFNSVDSLYLASCIAVCKDLRWGRCYESYSEDYKVVEEILDIVLGLQGDIPSGSQKGVPYVGGKYENFPS